MPSCHGEAQALYRQTIGTDPDDVIAITDLAVSPTLVRGERSEAVPVVGLLAGRSDLPQRVMLTGTALRAGHLRRTSGNGQADTTMRSSSPRR